MGGPGWWGNEEHVLSSPSLLFYGYVLLFLTDSSSLLSFCAAREKSLYDNSQFTDIWSLFLNSSVLQLFLESDRLMAVREKNPLHWDIWAWYTEDKCDNPEHVDRVGFPCVMENCCPLLIGGFCGILSGFLCFLPASTKLLKELVHTDCLCRLEGTCSSGTLNSGIHFL